MPTPSPVTDIRAEKLGRYDQRIADLEARLEREKRDRAELAASWGYQNGYRMRVSPDQMRLAIERS